MQFPTPKTLENVRQFLGLSSYYRRFIENYSKIAEPLSRLTKKDVKYVWETEQEIAFNILKDKLVKSPVLAHFDPSLDIEVRCDGSGIGLGSILLQRHEKGLRVVCYASRLLTKHEKNYPISEVEALA
ncbi:gag-pol fusion protein-like protein, partial [Dinothrombium tinctorium]